MDRSTLARWEAAWGESPIPRPFFRSELLGDAQVRILVCADGRAVRAGAIANRSRGVIGLTNVFDVERDLESAWSGAANAARAQWGGCRWSDTSQARPLTLRIWRASSGLQALQFGLAEGSPESSLTTLGRASVPE
jgi:hypothetical protein